MLRLDRREGLRRILSLSARIIVGGVFIYASLDKIAFPHEFANMVHGYNILPDDIGTVFAYILPWVELALGAFLVAGVLVRQTASILIVILIGFITAIIIRSFEGDIQNCGCFSMHSETGSGSIATFIIRNILLIFLCVLIITQRPRIPDQQYELVLK